MHAILVSRLPSPVYGPYSPRVNSGNNCCSSA